MQTEHHHDLDMALVAAAFNPATAGCDPSALLRRPPDRSRRFGHGCVLDDARRLTNANRVPTYPAMLVHADHFRFLLLNRPFPRAV